MTDLFSADTATVSQVVGSYLGVQRKLRELGQRELAEVGGIKQATYCRIEQGHIKVNLEMLMLILDHLEIPLSDIGWIINEVRRLMEADGVKLMSSIHVTDEALLPGSRVASYVLKALQKRYNGGEK
jgi:transcriptional regulator with XRE-family HTH domain